MDVVKDIPKYDLLRQEHKEHMNLVDVTSAAPLMHGVGTEIRALLNYGTLTREESAKIIPDHNLRREVARIMNVMIEDDRQCRGMAVPTANLSPRGDELVELFEKYIFTADFYQTARSMPNMQKFIRNRASLLIAKLKPMVDLMKANPAYQNHRADIKFPEIMQSVIRLHGAKVITQDKKVEEQIGVRVESINDSLFQNKQDVMTKIAFSNIHKKYMDPAFQLEFKTLHRALEKEITETPGNKKKDSTGEYIEAPTFAQIVERLQSEIENAIKIEENSYKNADKEFRDYRELKGYNRDNTKVPDKKYLNLQRKFQDSEKRYKTLVRTAQPMLEPELTLDNYDKAVARLSYGSKAGYMPPIPPATTRGGLAYNPGPPIVSQDVPGSNSSFVDVLDRPNVLAEIRPAIQEYHEEISDEYFREVFGSGLSEDDLDQKKEDEFYPALERDALRGGSTSEFVQNDEEAENILEHERKMNVSFQPGAWFKLTNLAEEDPEKAVGVHRILSNEHGMVYFEGHDRPMPQKELLQYLMNPNYGKISRTNVKVEFMYDGSKAPIRTLSSLEVNLGLRNPADRSPAPKITPFMNIVSYDTVNKKNEFKGRIQAISGDKIIMSDATGKPGLKISFEKFFVVLQANGWLIEPGSDNFDTLESISPAHGKKTTFVSLASLYNNLKFQVTSFAKKWKKTFDIWEMEDMVKGAKIGSDDWKEKNSKLMTKEKEEVDAKVKELGEKYPKGGPKRKGLAEFMQNPPDIRKFEGRVLAKAWLQVSLNSFGTIYPSGSLLAPFEKKRFWLRLFSVSAIPSDPQKYRSPIEEALDNASKVVGVTDARVELTALMTLVEQGKYTHPCVAGSMGKGFKGEISTWETAGKEATIKAKTDTISKATLPEIYKIISETIDNQEWPSLKDCFEKLAAKGYGAPEMFNLFFYAIDQMHYMEGGQHRCKMPLKDLAGMGKAIFGKFPLPIFAVMGSEENLTNFYRMMYNNPHIKNDLDWKSGNWKGKQVGDYEYKQPSTEKAKNLYKFFNAREGDYTMLRGISEDFKKSEKKPYMYQKEDEDYVKFRAMYETVFGNYTSLRQSADIDKKNWDHMPLLTLNDKYFSALHSGSPLKNGDWDTEEVKLYMESLVREYKLAMASNLPEADKDELQRRLGSFIWSKYWEQFKYAESTSQANEQIMSLVPDKNRDFFIKNYGNDLASLGFSHYRLAKKFAPEKEYIYPAGNPNKPIEPSGNTNDNSRTKSGKSNREYYKMLQTDNIAALRSAAPPLRT